MALVLKVKFEETLRRWVVPAEAADAQTFSLTLQQLESKIRDLFCLPPTAPLNITYVDNDNDMVTIGDDQDLVDACLVQQLNPLRLSVRVVDENPNLQGNAAADEQEQGNATAGEQQEGNAANPSLTLETLLKSLQSEAARDSVRKMFQTFTPFLDGSFTEQIMNHAEFPLREVLNKLKAGSMR